MSDLIKKLRSDRQEAQLDLAIMIRRMEIHQRAYDLMRREYTKTVRRYQKADLLYAMRTKVTICKAKTAKKVRKQKTHKNNMPGKVKALLNSLPENARKRIIDAYEN